jgi:hypothetical protein
LIDAHRLCSLMEIMTQETLASLEQLGLEAARELAGAESVEQVEVLPTVDYIGRPAYHFAFLIEPSRAQQSLGLIRLRLDQKLHDELDARGDEHRVILQMLDSRDWPKRANARTV